MNVSKVIEWLKGKKTYGVCFIALCYTAGAKLGWYELDKTWLLGFLAAAGITLRAGIANEIKKLVPGLAAVGLAIGLVLAGNGCSTQKLELGGAYAPAITNATTGEVTAVMQPDLAFYTVDAAFGLAYSGIDFVFGFERQNRAWLWRISPEIKHGLDRVRPEAVRVRDDYSRARAVYATNAVPANLTVLEQLLAKAQQVNATVTALLPAMTNAPAAFSPLPKR
jgi:hypothetical protein